MAKESKEKKKWGLIAGFKDPVKRPRFIMWTGVALIGICAFLVVGFIGSSTYWFCGSFCHSVQGDAVAAYDNGAHNKVSCLTCHEPVNGDPLSFTYRKVEAGVIGVYELATTTYALPLNATSHLALNQSAFSGFSDDHCTQCHTLENRKITPSEGIIINHDTHTDREIHCTACHNRVAHPEDEIEIMTVNPVTGDRAAYHADFMTMTACFRCHTLTDESPSGAEFKAPGTCSACHPADFDLKPANHDGSDFYPKGHADLAMMEVDHYSGRPAEDIIRPVAHGEPYESAVEGAEGEAEGEEAEGEGEEAEHEAEEEGGHGEVLELVPVQDVDYCQTCHIENQFCLGCHGMEMPHSEEFETKTHPETAATMIDKCEFCHQQSATYFCDSCHHGTKVDWTFDPAAPWQNQHAKTVVEKGVAGCLGACHEQQFCVDCHTALQPLPTSHTAADWLHGGLTVTSYPDTPAVPSAAHALSAQKSIDSCDVCHGPGGISAAFCANCHGIEMPHPDQFKTNHVSGASTPQVCANCHKAAELCSDCHHKGAVNGTPWQRQHPVTVAADGANPCFEKCHQDKQFCVACHTTLNAVPTSHTVGDWTHRATDAGAAHQVAYKAATDSCDYCHGDGGVAAAFCQNCHQLGMPHADAYDTAGHQADLTTNAVPRAVCLNCHAQPMCDSCHHPKSVAEEQWVFYHPNAVASDGAQSCFDCHEPTFCSFCHVNKAADLRRQ
ncbi:MAG: cytochrome c3 family protein [Coriobacteriia bacterium]|nr:cytochrome c3 family protein [Coriobacteriia bacterium]